MLILVLSLETPPAFSLLKVYSCPNKVYFHYIFKSCLNSPARLKNQVYTNAKLSCNTFTKPIIKKKKI
jgi:hypothetical protein